MSSMLRIPGKVLPLITYLSISLAALCYCALSWAQSAETNQPYIGSQQCASCHQQVYQKWSESHHHQAMADITDKDLPQFDQHTFSVGERQIRFDRNEQGYFIEEQVSGNEPQRYKVVSSLGFYPLQQYLIEKNRGHIQVFDIAWDNRPFSEGGQNWFLVDIDQAESSLSWHGSFMNWNSRCASCHTTNFQRNYQASDDSYLSQWSEAGVGCESCHGPGAMHKKAMTNPEGKELYIHRYTKKGIWQQNDTSKPVPLSSFSNEQLHKEEESCFNCHSRRQQLKDESNTQPFSETANLRLLTPELYFPDGQIKDEVFVAGSFLQSKMHHAGVTCSNCHDPHSNKLVEQGDALCGQCHSSEKYAVRGHHQHQRGSEGSQCVSCHMPTRTYMGIDERHDHAFQIPNPILSETVDSPNVCKNCHEKELSEHWLKNWIGKWWPQLLKQNDLRSRTAITMARLWQQPEKYWADELNKLITEQHSPLVKASLVTAGGNLINAASKKKLLLSENPLLEKSVLNMPLSGDIYLLLPKFKQQIASENLSVRIAAYRSLLPLLKTGRPLGIVPQLLKRVEHEYLSSLAINRDTPMGMAELANYHLISGDVTRAEQLLKNALSKEPGMLVATMNLADLYRQNKNHRESIEVLEAALIYNAQNHLLHYSLGLAYYRVKDEDKTISSLQKAYQLSGFDRRTGDVLRAALQTYNRHDEARSLYEKTNH